MRHVAAVLLIALVGCRFTFDREVSPGEIRGLLERQRSGDGGREPLGGATVRALGTPFLVRSGSDGRFIIRGMPSGEHTLVISSDPDGDGAVDEQLRLTRVRLDPIVGAADPRNARDLGPLLVEATGSVTGKLMKAGVPVVGAAVAVEGQPALFARTDVSGAFRFVNLAPGEYAFVALVPVNGAFAAVRAGSAKVSSLRTVELGAVEVNEDAPTRAMIAGQLIAEDKIGVTNYSSFRLQAVGPGGAQEILVNPDGSWRIELSVGVYALHLLRDGNVAETWMGGVSAYPDAVAPPIYIFDESTPFDYDQDGVVEGDEDSDNDRVNDADEAPGCRFDPDGSRDSDGDGLCDSADPDSDQDGVIDAVDTCPLVVDPLQADGDGDGYGDLCDNCPRTPNPDQRADACSGGSGRRTCSEDNGGCHFSAVCSDSPQGAQCKCPEGFTGDGVDCVPTGWSTLDATPNLPVALLGVIDPGTRRAHLIERASPAASWSFGLDAATTSPWRWSPVLGTPPAMGSGAHAFWDDGLAKAWVFSSGYLLETLSVSQLDLRARPWRWLPVATTGTAPDRPVGELSASWNPNDGRMLVCCTSDLSGLWTFDAAKTTWSQVTVARRDSVQLPSSTYSARSAYDPEGKRLYVLFSDSPPFAIDFSSGSPEWVNVTATGYDLRYGASLVLDRSAGRLLVIGGSSATGAQVSTATLDLRDPAASWTAAPRLDLSDPTILVEKSDAGADVYAFGGYPTQGAASSGGRPFVLRPGALAWSEIGPTSGAAPGYRTGAVLAVDGTDTNLALLAGVEFEGAGGQSAAPWVFRRGRGWSKATWKSEQATLAQVSSPLVVWDSKNSAYLVVGGTGADGTPPTDSWSVTVGEDAGGDALFEATPLFAGTVDTGSAAALAFDAGAGVAYVAASSEGGLAISKLDRGTTGAVRPSWQSVSTLTPPTRGFQVRGLIHDGQEDVLWLLASSFGGQVQLFKLLSGGNVVMSEVPLLSSLNFTAGFTVRWTSSGGSRQLLLAGPVQGSSTQDASPPLVARVDTKSGVVTLLCGASSWSPPNDFNAMTAPFDGGAVSYHFGRQSLSFLNPQTGGCPQ